MLPAEELAIALDDGEAMLELGADDIGAEDADDPEVLPEPPHAVRLSRAAAATPATVKVVRLKVCIVVLLGSIAADCGLCVRGVQPAWGVGTCPWLVSQWLFGRWAAMDGWIFGVFRFGALTSRQDRRALNAGIPRPEPGDSQCAQGGT